MRSIGRRFSIVAAAAIAAWSLTGAMAPQTMAAGQPETWYLAVVGANNPAAPRAHVSKAGYEDIVAGAFSTRRECQTVKDGFFIAHANECSDVKSCRKLKAMFERVLQCVRGRDAHWEGLPPQKRWFLFWGFDSASGKCRDQKQVVADRAASVLSSKSEAECKAKGVEFADAMLGKPAERPPHTPDCTYCIRGDDSMLRFHPPAAHPAASKAASGKAD